MKADDEYAFPISEADSAVNCGMSLRTISGAALEGATKVIRKVPTPSREAEDVEKILGTLARSGGLCQSEIAKRIGIPGGTMPARMKLLLARGKVIRHEDKSYDLTPASNGNGFPGGKA